MANDWYYKSGDEVVGPISDQMLKAAARRGDITPVNQIRLGAEGNWRPASKVKGLFPQIASESGQQNVVSANAPPHQDDNWLHTGPTPRISVADTRRNAVPPPHRWGKLNPWHLLLGCLVLTICCLAGVAFITIRAKSPVSLVEKSTAVEPKKEPFRKDLFESVHRAAARIESANQTDWEALSKLCSDFKAERALVDAAAQSESERRVLRLLDSYIDNRMAAMVLNKLSRAQTEDLKREISPPFYQVALRSGHGCWWANVFSRNPSFPLRSSREIDLSRDS